MNRLVADALIERAKQGQKIMVLTHSHTAARQAFTEIADLATDALRIRRANGNERIDYDAGGTIDVRPATGHGYRGMNADLVYVEREADDYLSRNRYADAYALVATTGGDIIRA